VQCDLGRLQGHDAVTTTLDLSVKGSETLITGTQLAGVVLDFSAPVCVFGQDGARSTVVCRVGRLERGAEVHLPINLSLGPGPHNAFDHTATVKGSEVDTDPSNNRVQSLLTFDTAPALADARTDTAADLMLRAEGPQNVTAGQPFTYTFTITNRGAMKASRVAFQDTLPPATDLQSFKPYAPPCARQGNIYSCHVYSPESGQPITVTVVITGTAEQAMSLGLDPLAPGWPMCAVIQERSYLQLLQCSLGTLEQGETANVEMVLIARGVQARQMVNTATVVADDDEPIAMDHTATTTITVHLAADLVVIPMVSEPTMAGTTVTYTLTVANVGPSDASDVVLTDNLPRGATMVVAMTNQGEECETDRSGNIITCRMGRLDSGEMASASIVISVDRLAETITHTVQARAKPNDPNPENNELTEPIPIRTE
jgi:uncharacterized repeat protein (TIGR01451 family)